MNLRKNKKQFTIPMNSMSDVAFLLLIFIMIVALINYRKTIKIDYPEARTALRTSEKKNLEVWVNQTGDIFLDGNPANYSLLENKISELYLSSPDTRVHIIADKTTPYQYINSCLEILQILQYRVVSFVVQNNE